MLKKYLDTCLFNRLYDKQPFDYTEWQKDLFDDMSVEGIKTQKHTE